MAGNAQPPGSSRALGASIADVLASDARPAPTPLTTQAYEFLGDADLPAERYICRDFFQQEMSGMWSRCWQWA